MLGSIIDLQKEGEIIEDLNIYKKFRAPFVIYADFESTLKQVNSKNKTQRHDANSYGLYLQSNLCPKDIV